MDFELSGDQRELRDAAARVLDRLASSERVRRLAGPPDGSVAGDGIDGELWGVLADQGWLVLEQPAAEGGLGLGMVEVCVLAEQLGRHVAPVPFFGTNLAQHVLWRATTDRSLSDGARRRCRSWLEALTAGEVIGCVAWSPDAPATKVADDGTCRVTAAAEPGWFASSAAVAIVASLGAVYALELAPDARPPAEPAMDRTRPVAWLDLADQPAVRLGGAEAAAAVLDRAATAVAADLLGACDRVLEVSVAYAKERHQFGKPIGSFQAVKHRLADALVDVEAMRSAVYYAAWCVATGEASPSLAASAAKAWCSDASQRVMASGLQVHGGMGFTWEHDLHLFVKRAQADQSSWGSATFHRERAASLLSTWKPSDPDLF